MITDVMENMEVSAYPTGPHEQRRAEWWLMAYGSVEFNGSISNATTESILYSLPVRW